SMTLAVVPKPAKLEESMKTVVRELKRFEKFGITEGEFQRALSMYSKGNEMAYQERDKVKSDTYVNNYLSHFLKGDAELSVEDEYCITKIYVATLTLIEVVVLGNKYYAEASRDMCIVGPEKDKDKVPTESVVNNGLDAVGKDSLTAYEDQVSEL